MQDEITLILATEMQVRLTEGEQARLRYSTTTNVEAWNLWVQGLRSIRTGTVTKDGSRQGPRCLGEGAGARSRIRRRSTPCSASCITPTRASAGADDRETAIAKGKANVERALAIDPGQRRRACHLELCSSMSSDASTRRWWLRGARLRWRPAQRMRRPSARPFCRRPASTKRRLLEIEKAMRLSPKHPANYLGIQGLVYRLAGRNEEAVAAFRDI